MDRKLKKHGSEKAAPEVEIRTEIGKVSEREAPSEQIPLEVSRAEATPVEQESQQQTQTNEKREATFVVNDEFKPPAPPSAAEIAEGVATSITEGAVEAASTLGEESFTLGKEVLSVAAETLKETGAEALRTAETVSEIVEDIVTPEKTPNESSESRNPSIMERALVSTQEFFSSLFSAIGGFLNTFFNTIYNVLHLFWTSTVWLIKDVLVPAVAHAALRGWEVVKWVGATVYDKIEYVARFSKEAVRSVVHAGKWAILSAVDFFKNLFLPKTTSTEHASSEHSDSRASTGLVLGGLAVAAAGFGLIWFLGFLPF